MQLFQRLVTPFIQLPRHNELERLIQQSLRGDWIIRIEHIGREGNLRNRWQQWGKALFAVQSADPVLKAIYNCHAKYRSHSIRIHAEKVKPQSCFYYSVYSGIDHPEVTLPLQPLASKVGKISAWEGSKIARTQITHGGMWRLITVVGVVACSILLLEGLVG